MIATDVARALQIRCLNAGEVERIHRIEIREGHYICPWNIQRICKVESILKYFGIPENNDSVMEAFASMATVIVNEFKKSKSLFVDFMNLESVHVFDWEVFNSDLNFRVALANKRRVSDQLEQEDEHERKSKQLEMNR